MKKILSAAFAFLLLAACQKGDTGFAGNEYRLEEAPDGAEITISFDGAEKRFYGKSAVNRYFGPYEQEGNSLVFGATGSTMMAGPENLMAAEQEYLQFLSGVKSFRLDGDTLILIDGSGKELIFKKIGTVKTEE